MYSIYSYNQNPYPVSMPTQTVSVENRDSTQYGVLNGKPMQSVIVPPIPPSLFYGSTWMSLPSPPSIAPPVTSRTPEIETLDTTEKEKAAHRVSWIKNPEKLLSLGMEIPESTKAIPNRL